MLNNNSLPKLELLEDGIFELTEDYQSILDVDTVKKEVLYILVPKGTETNFASIPAIGRAFVSPIDPTICRAALTHDYLVNEFTRERVVIYKALYDEDVNKLYAPHEYDNRISWKQSAACLRKIMEADGAAQWKRVAVYWSVRIYGALFK